MRIATLCILFAVGLVAVFADRFPPLPLVSYKPPASSSSTLNTSLIAYWKLGEASGTRVDSETTGTAQNLTDNNTVNQTNGIIGNAAWFINGNNEYLSKTDSADLSTGDIDYTVAGWVYFDTLTNRRNIFSKWSNAAGNREWYLFYSVVANRFQYQISSNGTDSVALSATAFGAPSTATWYLVAVCHDSVNNLMGISINGGAWETQSYANGSIDGTASFVIGWNSADTQYNDGRVDEVGFWKKVLSASEISELYNSGAGKTCCPF